MITYEDFAKIDMRVGKIVSVEDLPEAKKPIYKLRIDFGELGVKNIAAGIKKFYTKEQLMNKEIVGVVNLAPKNIANFMSEGMLLAVGDDENGIVLLKSDKDVEAGLKVK
jgi:tRNA-binding protein